jgi:hypothetical protein
MKTITEIIGGAQGLLNIPYNLQDVFEEYLTDEYKTFLHMRLSPNFSFWESLNHIKNYLQRVKQTNTATIVHYYRNVPSVVS